MRPPRVRPSGSTVQRPSGGSARRRPSRSAVRPSGGGPRRRRLGGQLPLKMRRPAGRRPGRRTREIALRRAGGVSRRRPRRSLSQRAGGVFRVRFSRSARPGTRRSPGVRSSGHPVRRAGRQPRQRVGGSARRRGRVPRAGGPSGRAVPLAVGRWQRGPHCVLHPVPLRLVRLRLRLSLVRRQLAALLLNRTPRSRHSGNGRGPTEVPRQPANSSASARRASRYEPMPKPATVPLATAATTDVCRNSSRAYGFEMCTSISGAVRWAAASLIAYE